jgi:hypothetical protein
MQAVKVQGLAVNNREMPQLLALQLPEADKALVESQTQP